MNGSLETFAPRWASPPGATLQDVLDERQMTFAQLATRLQVSPQVLDGLLSGATPITVGLARRLAEAVGATVEFWLVRDAQYREDLRRVECDKWTETLPISQMVSMGWIAKPSDWKERITACLNFFKLEDLREWDRRSEPILHSAYFRSSATGTKNLASVLAWMRQGEIVTSGQTLNPWRADVFKEALQDVRRLTREKDPAKFIPRLTHICNNSGVAFAVLKTPRHCPVSGVSTIVDESRPTIILSARHLSDDHLWFTFFHEAAHLLLHDAREPYIDDDDELQGKSPDTAEREANSLAEQLLVTEKLGLQDKRTPSHREVIRAAQQLGIAPGIIVGQLQHHRRASYDALNGLKRRYKWVETSLEMA